MVIKLYEFPAKFKPIISVAGIPAKLNRPIVLDFPVS